MRRSSQVHIRVMEMPKRHGTGCFDILLNRSNAAQPFACLPSGCPNPVATCHNYTLGLGKLLPLVSAYSSALGEFFGADWYRLDFFHGNPARGIRVNEVSRTRPP